MSWVKKAGSLISKQWYDFLFVPVFVLFIVELIKGITPVFDSLPDEFGGIARLLAASLGVLGILKNKEQLSSVYKAIIPVAAGAGLLLYLEAGSLVVLDVALIVLIVSGTDVKTTAVSAAAILACVTGATMLCSYKGYIRNYSFYGHEAFGFRTLAFYYMTVALIVAAMAVAVWLYMKKKDTRRTVAYLMLGSLISAGVVLLALKALNLNAAVEEGSYEIFSQETVFGIETQMKGFEDYKIALGSTAPVSFTITPEDNYYMITTDSYGVTKTLCVLDGQLYLGNYDQATPAHLWDIEEVTATPYFTITNVETGLLISASEDDTLELIAGGTGNEDSFFRIGSENYDYYESLLDNEEYDLHNAVVTCTGEVPYTGSAVIPDQVTVELNGTVLTEGTDYEVTYWDNYLPGTAHVTVTGTGDYEGSCGTCFEVIYDSNLDMPTYRSTADYVVRMYRMAYLRFPTVTEIEIMSQILIDGDRTPDSVVWELYWNDVLDGHSNAAFMEVVYRLMLLRNGSRNELAGWIGALETGSSRSDVISAISESPDYQNIWHNFGISFR